MRVAVVVLTVLLLAACPPRRGRVAYSVQPPTVAVMPTPVPPGPLPDARTIDPAVEQHLGAWETKMSGVTNLRTEISLKRTDAVFKKETNYSGVVLRLKPSHVVLRLDNADDPTKIDYEAYICDGKSVFVYSGLQKTVIEFKLPLNQGRPDNLLFDMLFGVTAADMKERFDISVFKTDAHYVYLDIKPRSDKDKHDFTHLRLALYGPGEATAKFAYLPAQVSEV